MKTKDVLVGFLVFALFESLTNLEYRDTIKKELPRERKILWAATS